MKAPHDRTQDEPMTFGRCRWVCSCGARSATIFNRYGDVAAAADHQAHAAEAEAEPHFLAGMKTVIEGPEQHWTWECTCGALGPWMVYPYNRQFLDHDHLGHSNHARDLERQERRRHATQ